MEVGSIRISISFHNNQALETDFHSFRLKDMKNVNFSYGLWVMLQIEETVFLLSLHLNIEINSALNINSRVYDFSLTLSQ